MELSQRNPWLLMAVLVFSVYGIYLAAQWPLAGNHLYGYISFNSKRVNAAESSIHNNTSAMILVMTDSFTTGSLSIHSRIKNMFKALALIIHRGVSSGFCYRF